MTFRIQYISNLLLPVFSKPIPFTLPVKAPCLALLGNIGTPECPKTKDFFQWADEQYGTVLWIPGSLEYSSNHSERCAWNERADACYRAIRDWKLCHTSFCQKMKLSVPFTSLTLLATPGGLIHRHDTSHFRWDTNGNYVEVEPNEYLLFRDNEFRWIENSLIHQTGPTVLLSHTGIVHTNLQHYPILANCYGITQNGNPESSTGGKPWSAINMAGHSRFRPEAVFEFDERVFRMKQQHTSASSDISASRDMQ